MSYGVYPLREAEPSLPKDLISHNPTWRPQPTII